MTRFRICFQVRPLRALSHPGPISVSIFRKACGILLGASVNSAPVQFYSKPLLPSSCFSQFLKYLNCSASCHVSQPSLGRGSFFQSISPNMTIFDLLSLGAFLMQFAAHFAFHALIDSLMMFLTLLFACGLILHPFALMPISSLFLFSFSPSEPKLLSELTVSV